MNKSVNSNIEIGGCMPSNKGVYVFPTVRGENGECEVTMEDWMDEENPKDNWIMDKEDPKE